MLEKINSLAPFFEDCYREISVREYAREVKISPPTASKVLKEFEKQGLLLMRKERGFLLFRINRESEIAKDISRIYWKVKLKEFINYLERNLHSDAIVLFGSLSKLEATEKSDIDIAVFSKIKKDLDLKKFEKNLGREIQMFIFDSFEKVNKQLKPSILNGYLIRGNVS